MKNGKTARLNIPVGKFPFLHPDSMKTGTPYSLLLRTGLLLCMGWMMAAVATGQSSKNVELLHADKMRGDADIGEDVRLLIGHVKLRHESAVMFCDSAVQDESTKSFDAFGNVHIIQGDTLNIYSDVLYYDGRTKLAKLRKNVRMINKEVILTTDKLNYDLEKEVGYYLEGGQIQDTINTIVSVTGTYFPKKDEGYFNEDVVLTTPDIRLLTDTLKYNTERKLASVLGPTEITDDTTLLYAENGYYDSLRKFAFIYQNASITNKEYYIKADTLTHSRYSHDSFGYNNVLMRDSVQRMISTGHYAFFNDSLETSFVTDSAVLMLYSSTDTLFLHADTLSTRPDTALQKVMSAAYNVRFYKSDLQGKCDSLSITAVDTVIHMHYAPVIWSAYNQLSGQVIEVFQKDGAASKIVLTNDAFMASMEDTVRFNQIKGRKITAHIKDNDLYRIDVDGNAESVYYSKDGPYVIGLNRTTSSNLTMFIADQKPEKIIMFPTPSGKLYPNKKLKHEIQVLPGFTWHFKDRPKNRMDIFRRTSAEK